MTSLTATLVKSVEVTEEACAVVWSATGKIKWCRKSESFRHFIPSCPLTSDTLAGRLFEGGAERELAGEVFASSWIENEDLDRHAKVWEESIILPNYDAVLTILTI